MVVSLRNGQFLERSRTVLTLTEAHVRTRPHAMFRGGHRGTEAFWCEWLITAEVLELAWSHSMFRGHHWTEVQSSKLPHFLACHVPVAHGFMSMHARHFFVFHVFAHVHALLPELLRTGATVPAEGRLLFNKIGYGKRRSGEYEAGQRGDGK